MNQDVIPPAVTTETLPAEAPEDSRLSAIDKAAYSGDRPDSQLSQGRAKLPANNLLKSDVSKLVYC